jgi:hypothetical protein
MCACMRAKSIKRSEKERHKVVFIQCYPKNKVRCSVATVMKITPAMPSNFTFGNFIGRRQLAFKKGCGTRFCHQKALPGSLIHTANSFENRSEFFRAEFEADPALWPRSKVESTLV